MFRNIFFQWTILEPVFGISYLYFIVWCYLNILLSWWLYHYYYITMINTWDMSWSQSVQIFSTQKHAVVMIKTFKKNIWISIVTTLQMWNATNLYPLANTLHLNSYLNAALINYTIDLINIFGMASQTAP